MNRVRLAFGAVLALIAGTLLDVSLYAAGKDTWVEVRSPNFTVISNAGEKEARKIADQFEQFREVFHSSFPQMRVDLGKPLIILAVKNEDALKQLLPEYWETKGHLHPAGIYVPGEDRHFVALRTNMQAEGSYEVVYHEYTHAILGLNFRQLPLWLGEGMAEFFGDSTIHDNYVNIGKIAPSHIRVLQESRLIPIDTLLQADAHSPYYNEAERASLFYAESWAIVHYLMMDPEARKRRLLLTYLNAWEANGDQLDAAEKAFGNLKEFSHAMEGYVRQNVLYVGKVNTSIHSDPKSYACRELPHAELAAYRALFYIHSHRQEEAKTSAQEALNADATLALAHEAKGQIAYSEGDFSSAEEDFARAIELHSASYFAYFYSAQARLRRGGAEKEAGDIAELLEKAITMNAQFAPAYAALASVYSLRAETHEKSQSMARKAVELEPGNFTYSANLGFVFLNSGKTNDAKALAARLQQAARTAEEKADAEGLLQAVANREAYEKAMLEAEEMARQATPPEHLEPMDRESHGISAEEREETSEAGASAVAKKHPGEDQFAAEGTILTADCNADSQGTVALRMGNRTLRFFYERLSILYVLSTAKKDSGSPPVCAEWKGRRARLYFFETKQKPFSGELDTIQFF